MKKSPSHKEKQNALLELGTLVVQISIVFKILEYLKYPAQLSAIFHKKHSITFARMCSIKNIILSNKLDIRGIFEYITAHMVLTQYPYFLILSSLAFFTSGSTLFRTSLAASSLSWNIGKLSMRFFTSS